MIGVLAGMGPRSTAPFIDTVIDQCQVIYGASDDIDFPPIMIYSLPTPFYIDRPLDQAELLKCIKKGLQKLASTGVSYIAMPCNSAHAYFKELVDAVPVPLLNMIDETVKSMPRDAKRVSVLATEMTMSSNIYQKAIKAAGFDVFHNQELQSDINELIQLIKRGENEGVLMARWTNLLVKLEHGSVDSAIVACTDLNVISNHVGSNILICDSALSLAKAVVREYVNRLKQS